MPQDQFFGALHGGPGKEGDSGADYQIGQDECIEHDTSGGPTAGSMALVTGVGIDTIANRLWVSQAAERGRVSIWNSAAPPSSSNADAFISARGPDRVGWAQLPGDLTVPTSGDLTYTGTVPNSTGSTSARGHVVRDPLSPSVWMPDGRRIVRLPDDSGTDQVFDSVVLGRTDLAGGIPGSSDAYGIFTAIDIAQRCLGGSAVGTPCTSDAACAGGGTCKVELAATDLCGMVGGACTWSGRVMVWTDLEAVTAGQAADLLLAVGGQPQGVAFVPTTGDLLVTDSTSCSLKAYTKSFGASTSPYAVVGGCGAGPSNVTMSSWVNGVSVSDNGLSIAVADTWYHRVLKWTGPVLTSGQHAAAVIGQPNFTTSTLGASSSTTESIVCDRFNGPYDVRYAPGDYLWVADTYNRRVLRFGPQFGNNEASDLLLGQSDCRDSYNLGATNWSYSSGNFAGLATFPNGAGYGVVICDSADNRCLVYEDYLGAKGRGPADAVIGQADFSGRVANRRGTPTLATLSSPGVPAIDQTTRALFIPDTGNNRVLRFAPNGSPPYYSTGMSALQPPLGGACNQTSTGLCSPIAAVIDPEHNLLVTDKLNGRLVFYCLVAGTHDGLCTSGNSGDAVGDAVYGQSAFGVTRAVACASPSSTTLCTPGAPAFITISDQLYLLVPDTSLYQSGGRVLGWSYPSPATAPVKIWGVRHDAYNVYDSGGIWRGAGTDCSRTGDEQAGTVLADLCDWSYAPWGGAPPRSIAVAPDGVTFYVGRAPGVVEFKTTSGRATRIFGNHWDHSFSFSGTGYVMGEWNGNWDMVGVAFMPNGHLWAVAGGVEGSAGALYGLLSPEATFTPTPIPGVTNSPTPTVTATFTPLPTYTPNPTPGTSNDCCQCYPGMSACGPPYLTGQCNPDPQMHCALVYDASCNGGTGSCVAHTVTPTPTRTMTGTTPTATPTPTSTASATATGPVAQTTLRVGRAAAYVGQTGIVIPIITTAAITVGSADVVLTFDPAVLQAVSCSSTTLSSFAYAVDNGSGAVTTASTSESGDSLGAGVELFHCTLDVRSNAARGPSVLGLRDADGVAPDDLAGVSPPSPPPPIPYTIAPGSVLVGAGDIACSGPISAIDASVLLCRFVGNCQDSDFPPPCNDPALRVQLSDWDCSGTLTPIDASITLAIVVGRIHFDDTPLVQGCSGGGGAASTFPARGAVAELIRFVAQRGAAPATQMSTRIFLPLPRVSSAWERVGVRAFYTRREYDSASSLHPHPRPLPRGKNARAREQRTSARDLRATRSNTRFVNQRGSSGSRRQPPPMVTRQGGH
jgi:hypothetical protein